MNVYMSYAHYLYCLITWYQLLIFKKSQIFNSSLTKRKLFCNCFHILWISDVSSMQFTVYIQIQLISRYSIIHFNSASYDTFWSCLWSFCTQSLYTSAKHFWPAGHSLSTPLGQGTVPCKWASAQSFPHLFVPKASWIMQTKKKAKIRVLIVSWVGSVVVVGVVVIYCFCYYIVNWCSIYRYLLDVWKRFLVALKI